MQRCERGSEEREEVVVMEMEVAEGRGGNGAFGITIILPSDKLSPTATPAARAWLSH